MQFYKFEPNRRTPFAPKFEIILLEDIVNNNFTDLRNAILEREEKIIEDNEYESDWGTGLGKNSMTSRSSSYNLLCWDEATELKKVIKHYHDTIMTKMHLDKKDVYCQCWANVMRDGEKIKPHRHSHDEWTYLSGHLCIQTNNTSTYYIHPYSREPFGSRNETNKITIFPSWMEHYTDRYRGDQQRITIAFDLYTPDAFRAKIIPEKKPHWVLLD
jgi:hypothetical protein